MTARGLRQSRCRRSRGSKSWRHRQATAGTGTAAESWPLRIHTTPGSGSVSIDDCIVTGNQAIGGAGGAGATNGADGQGLGGGIAILDGASVTIQKTKVRGNFASTADNDIYGTYST